MILHGLDAEVKKGDTIKDPKFTEEDNPLEVKKFDLVMANFPFSLEDWWKNGDIKKDKKGNPEKKNDGSPQKVYPGKETFADPYNRFEYGLPPFSNGDFAFLQHIIASLKDDGKAGVVCPQGVLFRGQPAKSEEEDGQSRKADDEYLIRRGFLQGKIDIDGEFTEMKSIIDAIVVLPGNLFYGTTIPGAILFFNKNKPAERKDKVLMVYAAKQGWYKEESNMNTLLPHDILRISTLLESWGNEAQAKTWIESQKARLRDLIQEDLDFRLLEIHDEFEEEIVLQKGKLANAEKLVANTEKPSKAQLTAVEKAKSALEKVLENEKNKIKSAHEQAEKERKAIDEVETEILTMLKDAELRKRYFAVVDMEELAENEFNLNIPRYVDTFEPEEEIDLEEAIREFYEVEKAETESDEFLKKILTVLK